MLFATNNPGTHNEYMFWTLSILHLSMDVLQIVYEWQIQHISCSFRLSYVRSKFFSTPPSDERFMFRSWRIRIGIYPVSHTFATTPAARALGQAAVRAVLSCRWGKRARWRKKQTKRSASSPEKGREVLRGLGLPRLQRHDSRYATCIYCCILIRCWRNHVLRARWTGHDLPHVQIYGFGHIYKCVSVRWPLGHVYWPQRPYEPDQSTMYLQTLVHTVPWPHSLDHYCGKK